MAILYGIADSERQLLNHLPGEVKSIDDIDRVKKQFQRKLIVIGFEDYVFYADWPKI